MKILLTCFEPFGGNATNVSSEVASTFSPDSIDGSEIVVAQLPVSFKRVSENLIRLIDLHCPNIILMLGQAGNRKKISIERIAINLMDSKMGDNEGFCPNEQAIIASTENALFSNMPLKKIAENWHAAEIDADISNSAGLYVCNCAFYNAIYLAHQKELDCKIGFIHLPKISNCEQKTLMLEHMHKTIKIALETTILSFKF